jgi:hypothetical protein
VNKIEAGLPEFDFPQVLALSCSSACSERMCTLRAKQRRAIPLFLLRIYGLVPQQAQRQIASSEENGHDLNNNSA